MVERLTPTDASANPALVPDDDVPFDRDWYLVVYPDVAAAGLDPFEHYRSYGKEEGRHPTPAAAEEAAAFDRDWYLSTYPDVAAAGIDPFKHYMAHGKGEGRRPTPNRYVFVAGCGHSGTTLMATILGCHSKIFTVRDELQFLIGAEAAERVREILHQKRDQQQPGKPIICEKTPWYVHHVSSILQYFPDARIVLMIRDGRDVTASLRKRTGSLDQAIVRWVGDTTATIAASNLPGVKIVKYEDLIDNPASIISDVCAFIGVVFQEQMLQFHEQEQNWFGEVELRPTDGVGEDAHRTNRNWQVHQPLYDGRGRWRDELNLEELVRFNRAAAPLMETLGYYEPTVGDLYNPFSTVPIETCATSNLKSYPSWDAQIHGEVGGRLSDEQSYDNWLDETHHRSYGRPWAIGRSYFEFFILRGVRPTDRFLDFGCGAGRLGIPMIRYLRPGHYFGIEPHQPSLLAFAEYEVPLHGMAYKAPRLLLDDTANLGHFGVRFDVIADLYVTHHLPVDLVQHIYTRFAEFLEPGGRVFVPHKPRLPADVLSALGFTIGEPEPRGILALERSHRPVIKTDEWHILRCLHDNCHANLRTEERKESR